MLYYCMISNDSLTELTYHFYLIAIDLDKKEQLCAVHCIHMTSSMVCAALGSPVITF